MSPLLPRLSWLVTARPWLTIAVLVVITVVLAAGAGRRAPVVEGAALDLGDAPGRANAGDKLLTLVASALAFLPPGTPSPMR